MKSLSAIYAKCSKSGECRLWNGTTVRGQSPRICVGRRYISGRRAVWAITRKTEPPAVLRMTCGNTLCLCAEHLAPSSRAEVATIAAAAGVYHRPRAVAHRLAMAEKRRVLTPAVCAAIAERLSAFKPYTRARRKAANEIAAEYGVTAEHILLVLRKAPKPRSVPQSSVWAMAANAAQMKGAA